MTVSIAGLPGAGKTTLCRPLAAELGSQAFVLGDALREQAAVDSDLQQVLSRGELAPEALVLDLVNNAIVAARQTGLVLDGFPRHINQLAFAKSHFDNWIVLCLDVDTETAISRLEGRVVCTTCGRVRSSFSEDNCPNCAALWIKRPEDASNILRHRIETFRVLLSSMLEELKNVEVHHIDATQSPNKVLSSSLRLLVGKPQ